MRTGEQTLDDFCSQLAAGTPAPGGGAVAAVCGALGAAAVSMTAGLTIGRAKYAAVHDEMVDLQAAGQRDMWALLACADEDRAAFSQVMEAYAIPKENKAERKAAIQDGYKAAAMAPLHTMQHSVSVMRAALAAASRGNRNASGDAYVGYLAASAAFEAGLWNVVLNLEELEDEAFRSETLQTVRRLRDERAEIAAALQAKIPEPVARLLNQP